MKKYLANVLIGLALVFCAGCLRVVVHGDPAQAANRIPETVLRAFKSAMPPVRIATYNVSLHADTAGGLVNRLGKGDLNARRVAAVIQHVRPDVILLNEFDYDAAGRAADLFQHHYLEQSQLGQAAIIYPYRYFAPVNTGIASGFDLDRDGALGKKGRAYGNDAWGFGLYPGQYGMLLLSRFPIDVTRVRSFRSLKWSAMPGATPPLQPGSTLGWYTESAWQRMPLSSKSHWDVPVQTPQGEIHVLASHPTPPAFDGPEDRNGLRNAAEIQLWNAYITSAAAPWLCDDGGACGGLRGRESFVVVGDLNSDPDDGDSRHEAIRQLLFSPRVARFPAPESPGASAQASRYGVKRSGDTRAHTADFGPNVGTLRVDYVLPSADLNVLRSGVFWPGPADPHSEWVTASDHHMVWVDVKPATAH